MQLAKHNEQDLRQCNANELFLGAVFWIKQEDGSFHKATIPEVSDQVCNKYRQGLVKFSQEGRLWTRRDKAFKHFWQ